MKTRRLFSAAVVIILLYSSAGVFAQETEPAEPFSPADATETEALIDDSFEGAWEDPFADPVEDDSEAEAWLDPFAEPVDDDESIEMGMFDDPFADSDDDDEGKSRDTTLSGETSDEIIADFEDFDSLFDTESMIDEVDEQEASAETGAADEFLLTEGVEFGGNFSGSLSSSWNYDYLYSSDFDITDPDSSLTPSISADLFFDARPESDFRVFGKLGFTSASGDDETLSSIIPEGGLTFEQATDADGNATFQLVDDADPDDPNQTTITQDDVAAETSTQINISVEELFADFDWDESLYFRFGKSMIKWGIGYFWSPTDVLNLTSIDVEDPTADREGPVSFKIHYPFDIHNVYLYLITENVEEPLDIALASKGEFVVGNTEFGIGGYYQKDLSPRLVATVSTSLGDIGLFGEGVVSWGSDRVFVRRSKDQSAAAEDETDDLDIVLDTYTVDDLPFFSATIGANYMYELEDDAGSLLLIGQYFFNGEGYDGSDPGLLAAAYRLALNSGENGLALPADEQPEGYEDPPALDTGDLTNFGMHYAGLVASWSDIFDSDVSFSTLAIMNITDLSGMIIPTISWTIMDYITMSAGARLTFGDVGDEYTNPASLLGFGGSDWEGPTMSLTLDFQIGGGSF